MENEVFKKKCEKCGKEIVSLSESQCEYNFQAHQISCKRKEDEKK